MRDNDICKIIQAALYVFGDKSQIKGVKLESHSKADFIPVEYPEPRR